MKGEQTYSVEYRDGSERWHRPRSVRFMLASDAVRTCAAAYPHGWRVFDADGRKVADHLGNGTREQSCSECGTVFGTTLESTVCLACTPLLPPIGS